MIDFSDGKFVKNHSFFFLPFKIFTMPKRKTKPTASGASTTASSSLMIRKPTPDKSVKIILLTKVQTESLMIDEVFSSLSTIEWSNVSRLVEESPSIYQDMLSSHDVYRNILASLSSLRRTTKNNTLGTYILLEMLSVSLLILKTLVAFCIKNAAPPKSPSITMNELNG